MEEYNDFHRKMNWRKRVSWKNLIPCVKYSQVHVIGTVRVDREKIIFEIRIIVGMISTREKSSIRPDFFLMILTPTF